MYSISAISGLLIAAVLYVPGTRQHEVTPVEDEPVVKQINQSGEVLQPTWYVLDPGGTPTNPADYSEATGGEESLCTSGQHICAIRATPDGTQPRLDPDLDEELLEMIAEASGSPDSPNENFVKKRAQP